MVELRERPRYAILRIVGASIPLFLSLLIIYSVLPGCKAKVEQTPARAEEKKTVRIGFMVCNSTRETEARFRPLTEYLSKKLGVNFVPVTIDTIDFEQAVREKKVDFTHTNSLLYIILNKNYGVEILAGDVNGKYGSRSAGAIVVKNDSPIKAVADLKGKRMVFGPMLAPTGYLSQYYLMLKSGFDPETGLAYYSIPQGSYKHEKVIFSLLLGDYDAAAIPMLDFEVMAKEDKIDPADFRIIAEAEPIPYCSFGVCEHVDADLAGKVKEALVSLKPEDTVEIDGERLKVLKAAMVEGFAGVKDTDYDLVREMARTCNMPPYQKF